MAPPPFASPRDKPAVCLLCCVKSACSPQLVGSALCVSYSLSFFVSIVASLSSSLSFLLFASFLNPTFFLISSKFPFSLRLCPHQLTPSRSSHFQRTLLAHSSTILLLGQ